MRTRTRILSLSLSLSACAEPSEDRDAAERLDACGLPEPCTLDLRWDGCASYDNWSYTDDDACNFAALAGDEPALVRATYTEPICGDVMFGVQLTIYRWADGSMTCIEQVSSSNDAEPVACSFADASLFDDCLTAAQAGELVSQACLDWRMWGVEFGEDVEPSCGPLP